MNPYDALRSRSAWIDYSDRGKIRATGEDRARLLHAMSTNDVSRLPANRGLYTFFLTAQGRILADSNIFNLGESLWLDTEPETGAKLLEHLDRYIIADDVILENEGSQWSVIGVEGPHAGKVGASLGVEFPSEDFAVVRCGGGFVARMALTGPLGLRFFIPAAARGELVEKLAKLDIPQASAKDCKIVRLENGRARYGEDISERYLVQETQLLQAVSFNKGCYLGQEIVERVRSRGQVHRLLTPVRIVSSDVPVPGTKLRADEKDTGEITSAAFSPALGEVVALAYVRAEKAAPATRLTLDDAVEAYVA